MKLLFRVLATLVVVLATYPFAFWMSGALLLPLGEPFWLAQILGIACAVGAGWLVWARAAAAPQTRVSYVVIGAFVVGAIGFLAGFVGPMLLTPEANQGPLLGFFFTGPLGALLGAAGGAALWWWSRQQRGPV